MENFKHKSTQSTVDANPALSSFERKVEFETKGLTLFERNVETVKNLYGHVTQTMRHELLRSHLASGRC